MTVGTTKMVIRSPTVLTAWPAQNRLNSRPSETGRFTARPATTKLEVLPVRSLLISESTDRDLEGLGVVLEGGAERERRGR